MTGIAKPDRSAAENLEQLRRENAGTIVWRNAPALPVHGPTINHIPFRDSRGGRDYGPSTIPIADTRANVC